METEAPIHVLLRLLGRRWALRVVWELREPAPTFRALQDRCGGVSSSVLAQRLADLRDGGIVAGEGGGGYRLTAEGTVLVEAFAPLETWARWWARPRRQG